MQLPSPQKLPSEPPVSRTPPVDPRTTAAKNRMHGGDRRKQLLRVAIETFARNGFSGTKTKDIAAAAGVSEAILFRHFATKEDLYHAILDEKEDEAAASHDCQRLREFMNQRDDNAVFRLIGENVIRAFRDDPAFQRLILFATLEGHLMASLFQQRFAARGEILKDYIVLRQKEGAFRKHDPDLARLSAVALFVHYAMGRYVFGIEHHGRSDEAVLNQLVSLSLNGLAGLKEIRGVGGARESIHVRTRAAGTRTRKDIHAKS